MIEPLPNTRGSVVYAGGNEGSDVHDPLQTLASVYSIQMGVIEKPL